MNKTDMQFLASFLQPTVLIDSDHPDPNSPPLIDYFKDYGMVPDVTFNEMFHWLQMGYPHLIEGRSVR